MTLESKLDKPKRTPIGINPHTKHCKIALDQ